MGFEKCCFAFGNYRLALTFSYSFLSRQFSTRRIMRKGKKMRINTRTCSKGGEREKKGIKNECVAVLLLFPPASLHVAGEEGAGELEKKKKKIHMQEGRNKRIKYSQSSFFFLISLTWLFDLSAPPPPPSLFDRKKHYYSVHFTRSSVQRRFLKPGNVAKEATDPNLNPRILIFSLASEAMKLIFEPPPPQPPSRPPLSSSPSR